MTTDAARAGSERATTATQAEVAQVPVLDAATLDALPDAAVVIDLAGRIWLGNRAAARLLALATPSGDDFAHLVSPSSQDAWQAHWRAALDAAPGAAAAPRDIDLLTAAGDVVPADVTLAVVASPDRPVLVALLRNAGARRQEDERTRRMLSDMDEHRARVEAQAAEFIQQAEALHVSQQRLSLILASTQDAYWDWDLTTGLVDFNQRFAESLGLSDGTAEPIARFVQRVHAADRPAVTAALARVEGDRAADVSLGEFRLRHGNGRSLWVHAKGQVVAVDETGRPRRAVGMLSNINDRKVRDEEQQRLQRLEAVGGLAAGVAHEINTPLQLVGDNLSFLSDNLHFVTRLLEGLDRLRGDIDSWQRWRELVGDLLTPDIEGDLSYVKAEFPLAIRESIEGIERVSRIVRALKEFAHPGHSERERVDLRRIIDNAVTLTRNQWKFSAEIVTEFGPLPEALLVSQGECTQLLVTLIVNAAQALSSARRESKGTITVRAHATEAHCVVEVEDTGPGIAPELQARVFDPFLTPRPAGQGTGQGLALARTIVQRHGGAISFESVVGQGTTFTVRLPLAPAVAGPAGAAA